MASGMGIPGLRIVPNTVPTEATNMQKVEAGVNAVMNDIVAGLTKPLTDEEKSPRKEVEKASGIVFKGNLDEVNLFFYRRGWTDGLPIICNELRIGSINRRCAFFRRAGDLK